MFEKYLVIEPFNQEIYHEFILQDDNPRPHRDLMVRQNLDEVQAEGLDWSATSPDMNPIEYSWEELKRTV